VHAGKPPATLSFTCVARGERRSGEGRGGKRARADCAKLFIRFIRLRHPSVASDSLSALARASALARVRSLCLSLLQRFSVKLIARGRNEGRAPTYRIINRSRTWPRPIELSVCACSVSISLCDFTYVYISSEIEFLTVERLIIFFIFGHQIHRDSVNLAELN